MATYIQIDEYLPSHHKFCRLCTILNCAEYEAVGYLALLWMQVLRVAWRDGDLSAYGDAMIEKACNWRGKQGVLVKALQTCGKIKNDGTNGPGFLDGYIAHNWSLRASRLIRDRIYREEQRGGAQPRQPSVDETDILELWNVHAKERGLPHAARTPKLNNGMLPPKFKLVLESSIKQPFLYGSGKESWRMNLDWLLAKDHADSVLAGKYIEHKPANPNGSDDDYHAKTREILAKRAAYKKSVGE